MYTFLSTSTEVSNFEDEAVSTIEVDNVVEGAMGFEETFVEVAGDAMIACIFDLSAHGAIELVVTTVWV